MCGGGQGVGEAEEVGEEGGGGVVGGGGGGGGETEGEREAFTGGGLVESGRTRELGEFVPVED